MSLENTIERIKAVVLEQNPSVDLSPGSVLSELLVKLHAVLHEEITVSDIQAISDGRTVSTVLASSVETYSPVMDAVASNYGVTRNEGQKVSGVVKITVSSNRGIYLPAGTALSQPTLKFQYVTTVAYDVVTSGTSSSRNVQLDLKEDLNGLYTFLLPVEASDVGEDGGKNNTQVSHGTRFDLVNAATIPGFVKAEAYGNFSSGRNRETDRELIARFREGLSHKGLTSAVSISSVLKDVFPVVQDISVAGAGDVELVRDKHNAFGMSTFGKADVYVRSSTSIESDVVEVTGTRNAGTGRWTVQLDASASPGFYRVTSILPKNAITDEEDPEGTLNSVILSSLQANGGSLKVYAQSYGFTQTTGERNNDVVSASEARFTRYQTCTVEFEYASTASTEQFYVQLARSPLLNEIQDYLNDDDTRHVGSDYLVKGIVPCIVSVSLKLVAATGSTLPVESIRADIFDYINGLKIGDEPKASKIVEICHNYAQVAKVTLPITLKGSIWLPGTGKDGVLNISGVDRLSIPYEPTLGVTAKTVAFFASYLDDSGAENIVILEA